MLILLQLIFGHQVVEVCDFHEVQIIALVRLCLVLRLVAACAGRLYMQQIFTFSQSRLHYRTTTTVLFILWFVAARVFALETHHGLLLMFHANRCSILLRMVTILLVNQQGRIVVVPQDSYGFLLKGSLYSISTVSLLTLIVD